MTGLAARFGQRWCVAYLVLYMVPFPLGHVPGLDALVHVMTAPWRALVGRLGAAVFGVDAVLQRSGSGDTVFHFVELACVAALATLVAIAWSMQARGAAMPGRVVDLSRAYARVYLGCTLLMYGWSKLIPLQFPVPGPDRMIVPLGDMSPMGLLWTFMGASTPYQMLAGGAEVLAGALLLWRRTALAGALLAAAVMSNVVALNFFYDVAVKLGSLHLLLLTGFILAPDVRRLVDVVLLNRATTPRALEPYPLRSRRVRCGVLVSKLALIGLMSLGPVIEGLPYARPAAQGEGSLYGVWRVERFTRGAAVDHEVPDESRWIRLGFTLNGRASIQTADGHGAAFRGKVEASSVTLTRIGESEGSVLWYRWLGDGRVELSGSFDGASVFAMLRRDEAPSALLSRGFHLIQDRPFNR